MVFVWRGRGYVAVFVLIVPLAAIVGLIDWNVQVALSLFGVTLLAAGLICRHYGKKWNRGSGLHAVYWMPLERWAWGYIFMGGIFSVLSLVGWIVKAVGR